MTDKRKLVINKTCPFSSFVYIGDGSIYGGNRAIHVIYLSFRSNALQGSDWKNKGSNSVLWQLSPSINHNNF